MLVTNDHVILILTRVSMCVYVGVCYPTRAHGLAANAMQEPYPSIDMMKLKFTYFKEELINILCGFCRCFNEKHSIFLRKLLSLLQLKKKTKNQLR